MKAELKRCPFCNGHNLQLARSGDVYQIICLGCYGCGPTAVIREHAVGSWNHGAYSVALVNDKNINRDQFKEVDL